MNQVTQSATSHLTVPNAITPINIHSLPKGKLLAFYTNHELVATFNNSKEAAEACELENYYRVYVNKRFIPAVFNSVTTLLFFAPGRTKPVVMTNVVTGLVVSFLADCCKQLGLANSSTGFINTYVKGNCLYRDVYKFCYSIDYKGPTPKHF